MAQIYQGETFAFSTQAADDHVLKRAGHSDNGL
jgi:hypothetical protein